MKIGYSVEGSTDRAVLEGLRSRWCLRATLIEGHFRGSTKQSRRRECPQICAELSAKGADVIVFMTDADAARWRDVKRREQAQVPEKFREKTVCGVAGRNVESWICADPEWLAKRLRAEPESFRCEDPKRHFEKAIGVCRDDRKEAEIASLMRDAPLKRWLQNDSFADFYDQVRQQSKKLGCDLENLRE